MLLECSAFTLNKYSIIGFKLIIEMKGCVPSDLRCEMIVRPLDRGFRVCQSGIKALAYDLDENFFSLHLGIDE